MANLNENFSFDNVYQIEVTDSVLGGPGGTANVQAQALVNRTRYLLTLIQSLQSGTNASNLSSGTVPLARLSGITNAQLDPNAAIDWAKVNKTGSSLADLTTRSASDLNTGTISSALLPVGLQNTSNFQLTTTDALRFKDSVASQTDIKTMGGLERVLATSDFINGQYVPRDKRVSLSGPWAQNNTVASVGYPIPLNNQYVPNSQNATSLVTNVANSTQTVTFYGTALNVLVSKGGNGGTFTVSVDGGATTTYDTYNSPTISFCQSVNIATGLALGSHTVVLTVTGTKGGSGASADANVIIVGYEVLYSTDGTIKNSSGNAFAASSIVTATAGSNAPAAIGTAIYRKDLAYITKGSNSVQIAQGYAGASADTLATFKANNAIKYRVEAEDTTGKLASIWSTAIIPATPSVSLSGGQGVLLGNSTTVGDTSGTDYMTIGFVGTGCNLLYVSSANQGILAYSVDGGAETNVDCYSTLINYGVSVNVAYNLPYGYHQVKIRKTGTKNASSGNYYITLDAFDIYQPVAPALPANSIALCEVLNTPTAGKIRHGSQAEWLYSGVNWSTVQNSGYTNGNYKLSSNADGSGFATLSFYGTAVTVSLAGAGGTAAISVDGGAVTNTTSTATFSGLSPNTLHTVKVQNTNTGGGYGLDYADVTPLQIQCLDIRNVFAHDTSFATQAVADHLSNQRHPSNSASVNINGAVTSSLSLVQIGPTSTITTKGGQIRISMSGDFTAASTGSNALSGIYFNGAVYNQLLSYPGTANVYFPIVNEYIATVPAGTYSFGLAGGGNNVSCTYYANVFAVEI